MKRLGVNIDHVATIRNARGGIHPNPLNIAKQAINFGADSITIHLREDRRHIKDNDLKKLSKNKNSIKFRNSMQLQNDENSIKKYPKICLLST